MRKSIYLSFIVCLISITSLKSQNAYIPPEKPKLIVGIVIEQFRYDYLDKFWDSFGDDGFKKLINEGTFCKNASYDYFFTQSAPAHATLVTGTNPGVHGIVADNWYHPLRDEILYCTADHNADPVGGSFENGLHSTVNMLPSTFGDELKLSNGGTSKVFALGMKEHTAILSGGHSANAAYWFDDISGTWMTSTHYIDSLPGWVEDFNAKLLPDTYLDTEWNTLLPVEAYNSCLPDTNIYEAGINDQSWFPYDLKKMSSSSRFSIRSKKRDYSLLGKVPAGDTYTTDFALQLIEAEELGADDITDFLSVSFSATDYIGHSFGPSSVEMADAVLRLDRN
ncbi:MAG: alkaline phosphatase family protein, partial [Bacteroidales bacterium]|nr:alkaline phosphatase family protein [Bacteroidales bacterium]